MEFSSPNLSAIDFAHYSNYPSEFADSQQATYSDDDDIDDGFSSDHLDNDFGFYLPESGDEDGNVDEDDIFAGLSAKGGRELLIVGDDYADDYEDDDHIEGDDDGDEYGDPLSEASSDDTPSSSLSRTESAVGPSSSSKRAHSSVEDDSSSCSSASSDDGGIARKLKRPRLDSAATKPAFLLASSTEMLRIRFPYQSLSLRLSDFLCLREGDLLNDNLIDFYLNHVVEHVLPDESDRRVTVLPSTFWHNLSLRQSISSDEDSSADEGADEGKVPKGDRRQQNRLLYQDILEFVEDYELIDVDYVVVPVNEWEHWSLAIVCHPFTPSAAVICLDSQLAIDANDLHASGALIADFFDYAYSERCGVPSPQPTMKAIVPRNLMQQSNHYDCGLFVLEYARRFLLAPPSKAKITPSLDFAAEYADFTVDGQRAEIQRVILSLCANRALWERVIPLLQVPPAHLRS